ncbi:MAG: OB-fold nucleic acid binding domain-containing protein [Nanoarchaeota archaeon]
MKIFEKITLKFALIIFLIGLFILLLIANISESKQFQINEINKTLLDKKVKISGEILNIKSFEESNFQIISLKDNSGKIDVTLDKITNLQKNQSILVFGKVTEYITENNSTIQVQAEKIVLLK